MKAVLYTLKASEVDITNRHDLTIHRFDESCSYVYDTDNSAELLVTIEKLPIHHATKCIKPESRYSPMLPAEDYYKRYYFAIAPDVLEILQEVAAAPWQQEIYRLSRQLKDACLDNDSLNGIANKVRKFNRSPWHVRLWYALKGEIK